jgi:hypothetical protein
MAHTSQQSPELQTQQYIGKSPQQRPLSRAETVPFQEALEDVGTLLAFAEGEEETTDPRAEGACLFDLTPEEWRFVRNAPLTGFLMVAGADGTVLPRERRALVSALEQGKSASCEIFRAVCRELYRQRKTLMEVLVSDTFEREQLSEAYRLVSGNLGSEEAERFKECLLKLGRQVAKASGGLIASWGGLRGVERRALADLATAFGTGR